MIWYKTNLDDRILLQARAELDDGDSVGDVRDEMPPGEEYAGLSYDEWRALPDGPVEVRYDGSVPVSVRPVARGRES